VLPVLPFSLTDLNVQYTPDNVAYGIIAGLVSFILLHNLPLLCGLISPRLLPPGWNDLKEPYNVSAMIRAQSGSGKASGLAVLPPWMRKVLTGNKQFWKYTPEEIERHLEGRNMTAETDNAAAELRQKERDDMRKMLGESVVRSREVTSLNYDVESGKSESPSPRVAENEKDQDAMLNPAPLRHLQ
jgi:AGZA family xanthine/uracil permease-like MFS transporter